MFKIFYTTQMSSNARQLQTRFTKMHSKSGRFSKLMATVMAVAIIMIMATATVVMAAVGADGLEHWTSDEIYFRDGMTFSINVSGKHVPAWVYEDVAGEDGNIIIGVKEYQIRKAGTGYVVDHTLIELTGTRGTTRLASDGHSTTNLFGGEFNFPYEHRGTITAPDTTEIGGYAEYMSPFVRAGLVDADSGKLKYVKITAGVDKDRKIEKLLSVSLCVGQEKAPLEVSYWENFDDIAIIQDSVSYTGDFETEYFKNKPWNEVFTMYEDNYQNRRVEGINVEVVHAGEDNVAVGVDTTLPQAVTVNAYMWDKDGNMFARKRGGQPGTVILETDEALNELHGLNSKPVKGETYRICVGIKDSENRLIYRWQEYVTIK